MTTNILRPVKSELTNKWTQSAIECYERGCVCNGCFYQNFFTPNYDGKKIDCQMKRVVLEICKKVGKPTKENTNTQKSRGLYKQP